MGFAIGDAHDALFLLVENRGGGFFCDALASQRSPFFLA
jgi:hypothetical protein